MKQDTQQDNQSTIHPDDYEQLLNDYLNPSGLNVGDFDSIQEATDFVQANVTWSNLP
jgi:hypothetical protein